MIIFWATVMALLQWIGRATVDGKANLIPIKVR